QESLASRPELDHARGDRFAHEFSIIKSAGEPRSQRQRFAEFLLDARRVKLGKPLRQRLREQLAGAHRIIDTLTGDGVNKPAGISRQRPTRAAQPEAAPCVHTERGKQVAVDLSALKGISEAAHEAVEPVPQARHATLTDFSANAHGEVIRARKSPGIAFKTLEELHAQQIVPTRHVIAKGEHEIVGTKILRQKGPK